MSLLRLKTQYSSIGLELDKHQFRAVQLERDGDKNSVHAWAVFPRLNQDQESDDSPSGLPDASELEWALSILSRRGFKGTAISCAPQTRVCSQHVFELPPVDSGAPLDQLARAEVARARKCAPDAFEFGLWSLPQRGRSSESMAVACPSEMISGIIEEYQAGGMSVTGIDLPELAIMRGVLDTTQIGLTTAEPEIDAVLQVNWHCSLAIVTLGHQIVYVRRISHGANSVWEQACNRFGLNENSARAVIDRSQDCEHQEQIEKVRSACWSALSKELASEIDVAIAYVSHSFRMAPLGKLIMSGYGSMNPTLVSRFDSVLGIPVIASEPQPICNAMTSEQDSSLPAKLSYAYGLAARFDV